MGHNLLEPQRPAGRPDIFRRRESHILQGFGRSKLRFILSAIGQARNAAGIVLAAHPNLAPAARGMKLVSPRLKTIVMSHGVEVWKPLALLRRNSLRNADIALAQSTDTAQKLTDIQGVSPKKIRRLAWPLSPTFVRPMPPPNCCCRKGFRKGKPF